MYIIKTKVVTVITWCKGLETVLDFSIVGRHFVNTVDGEQLFEGSPFLCVTSSEKKKRQASGVP